MVHSFRVLVLRDAESDRCGRRHEAGGLRGQRCDNCCFLCCAQLMRCDEYLLENKEKFLDFIKTKAEKEYKTFPMVFLEGKFIGGFMETKASIDINSDND